VLLLAAIVRARSTDMNATLRTAGLALATLLLAGCGDDPQTGKLSLAVTDAAVDDATSVVVTFTGVELQPKDGTPVSFVFETPRQIDLLALQGGLSAPVLTDVSVPAGEYVWIRLMVASSRNTTESFVVLEDASVHPLYVPSGAESGLKLHNGIVIAAGGAADFTVDFDLRKSVHAPQGGNAEYLLRPSLRLVDNLEVGAIAGTVAAGLVPAGCTPAVYAYSGTVTPDDMGSAVPPLTSSPVTAVADGGYQYRLAFLAAGAYTVAFTCDAALDLPDGDDAVAFGPTASATVVAGQTTAIDF
jgi:hypothetical protein